ncbi:MAG: beta-agarase, partial [Verrucomicrobia bacterium]|nr:beta-agarase [Verrucomicrobiota bacterium]
AAPYCDAIGFNKYEYDVGKLKLPDGIDRPVVIGEFHFGALDRGMFHTGLKATADQNDRAAKFKAYLESALRHPNIVGAHWFQYRDQATTGRTDGENYQIGLVDICDTPYPETLAAARAVGAEMYALRAGAAAK